MLLRLIIWCVAITIPTTLARNVCDVEKSCCRPLDDSYPESHLSALVMGLGTFFLLMLRCGKKKTTISISRPASVREPAKEMKSLVYQQRFRYKLKWHSPSALIHFSPVAGKPGHLVGSGTDEIGDFNVSLRILSATNCVQGTKIYLRGTGNEKENHGQTVTLVLSILTHWSPYRCPGLIGTHYDPENGGEDEFQLIPAPEVSHKLAKSLNCGGHCFHPLRLLVVGCCVASLILTTYTPGGGGIWEAAVLIAFALIPNNWHYYIFVLLSNLVGVIITCFEVAEQLNAVGIIEDGGNCGVAGDGGLFATYCTDEADQGCVVIEHWRGQCENHAKPICVGMSEDLYEDLDTTVALIRAQVYLLMCGLVVLVLYSHVRMPKILPENLPEIDKLVSQMKQEPDYERLVSELKEAASGDPGSGTAVVPAAGNMGSGTVDDVEEGGGAGVQQQQQQESDVASTSIVIPVAMGIPLLAEGGGGEG